MSEAAEVKAKVEREPIINGRMPVAVVHLARFGNTKSDATKDQAAKFGTTVGKIDDIKKNRNFAYVAEDTKFTDEQVAEGIAWLKRHPKYDATNTDALVVELDAYQRATPEEAATFAAARTAARGQATTTKDGAVADGGGGNRRGRKPKAKPEAEVEGEVAEASAEDLMD